MRSKAGKSNRQGGVDFRFAQVSAPQLELWLGLAWPAFSIYCLLLRNELS